MAFTIGDLFEHAVDRMGERIALVQGGRSLTYLELEEQANRLAHHLSTTGVQAGDRVAVYARNSVECVVAMLAIAKIRALMVNINYRYVASELRYLLENSDSVAVLCEPRYLPVLAEVLPQLPLLREVVVLPDADGAADSAEEDEDAHGQADARAGYEEALRAPAARVTPYAEALAGSSPHREFATRSDDDLYILYTGGTTGAPKGVLWRQEDVIMVLGGGVDIFTGERVADEWALSQKGLDSPGQLIGFALPPFIHGGAQWAVLMSLFAGGRTVVEPGFDPETVWRRVAEHGIHMLFITGDAMARPLIETYLAGEYDASSLFLFASSAALFSPSVKDQFLEAFPNLMITDSVGSSETGFAGTSRAEAGSTHTGGPRVNVDAQTHVLAADGSRIEPGSGLVGKLARSGYIPLGYHKDEEKTAATFPVINGVRYSIPGDDARVEDDGSVTMLGRGSVSINTGGEKVHPEEVEAALKTHPDIYDALIIGVPDQRMGHKVAAVIRTRDGQCPPIEDVNIAARAEIARYKCPRALWVVDEIRRTPAGKPDYRWASEIASARPADDSQEISS